MFEDTESSDFTPLESVQAALLLSFCERRHPKLELSQNRHWLQIAISKLRKRQSRDSVPFASETHNRSLWLRIWWTCYLYERLDGFHPNSHVHGYSFRLNAEIMPLLTMDDFDLHSSPGLLHDMYHIDQHFMVTNLRMASIHIQKIWLATKIDEIMRSRLSFQYQSNELYDTTTSPKVLNEWHFWNAHTIQFEFDAWQKRTSNTITAVAQSSQDNFPITVHSVSLYLLHYRVVISSYNAAMSTPMPISPEDHARYIIGHGTIRNFYMEILNLTKRLLDHGQAVYAHAAYPMIWTYLLTTEEVFPVSERIPADTYQKLKLPAPESSLTVSSYNDALKAWNRVPHPATTHFPNLFRFPSMRSSSRLNELWEVSPGTSDEHRDGVWDEMDSSFMIENMESLVYSPGTG